MKVSTVLEKGRRELQAQRGGRTPPSTLYLGSNHQRLGIRKTGPPPEKTDCPQPPGASAATGAEVASRAKVHLHGLHQKDLDRVSSRSCKSRPGRPATSQLRAISEICLLRSGKRTGWSGHPNERHRTTDLQTGFEDRAPLPRHCPRARGKNSCWWSIRLECANVRRTRP